MKNCTFTTILQTSICVLSITLFFSVANAQRDGTLDSTFGVNGVMAYSIGGNGLSILPDGRFYRFGNYSSMALSVTAMRSLADGAIDSSFGINGVATMSFTGTSSIHEPNGMTNQPDGKLLIVAVNQHYITPNSNVDEKNLLVRFDTSGTPDLTREFGVREICFPTFVSCQPNGKILVSGASYYTSSYMPPQPTGFYGYISRFNIDGTDDVSFANAGTFEMHADPVYCPGCVMQKVAVCPSGKLAAFVYSNQLIRLKSNGISDPYFGSFGQITLPYGVLSMAVQPDNKIITSNGWFSLTRYNADGSIDNSFGNNGVATIPSTGVFNMPCYDMAIQPDGKILAAGSYDSTTAVSICCRFNSNGTLDSSFGVNGTFSYVSGTTSRFFKVGICADKILLNVTGTAKPTYLRLNNIGSMLPVRLLTFTARLQDNKALLTWTVENEQNFDRYQIERSNNGKDFTAMGSVKANNSKAYSYIDAAELSTRVRYYRLKLIDRDGKFEYSPIRSLTINHSSFTITPNPAHDRISLSGHNMQSITIADMSGKIVLQQSLGNTDFSTINIARLAKGVYTIKIKAGDGVQVEKLVVE